jgi:hypothetical protein
MGSLDERISEQFAAWEQRGRGWQVWPEPVLPEPPFQKFSGYQLAPTEVVDDGRKPGLLASLFDSFKASSKPPVIVEEQEEPEPRTSEHPLTTEFVAALPAKMTVSDETWRAFLDSLHVCTDPIAFELFGKENSINVQLVSSPHDAPALHRQLTAFVPDVPFIQTEKSLAEGWTREAGIGFIVDFGLANEFMLPLQVQQQIDSFVGLVAAMSELRHNETAMFQIIFQPVQHPWAESTWDSVTDRNGKMIFTNIVPLIPGTKEKLASPLFGVMIRAAAQAETFERAAVIVQNMARALHTFARPENNHLIPLTNDDYPFEAHEEDLLNRQSRRSGMLLNREELGSFVHLPGDEVRSPKLRRQSTRTKAAPSSVLSPTGILFGINEHGGRSAEVRMSAEQRVRHTHILGTTGQGKSTLLFNLLRDDIFNGEGVALLDPAGDLVDRVLGIIPAERVPDVVLFDATDEQFSVGFNILSAHSDFEKTLLASDLVSVFRRLSSSWGDQLNSVLNNAILAFLESSEGGTLADLRRFLLDAEYRNRFLEAVRDPDIVFYWRKAFPQLGGNKSIGPVLTRLDTFLNPKPIRYMVSQRANRLDFADILDTGKIFLAKLPQGQIGKENSFLLGSLLVSKFQQLAMSRQRMSQELRRNFWFYIDEFHNFITPSMAEILEGARKYRLGLILAHHDLQQLQRDPDVASALMSQPYTRISFRVGDADARILEKGFASFEARDLQNLEVGEAICRIERSDFDFNLSIPLPEEIDATQASETRRRIITASREKYATPRAEIEAALLQASIIAEPEKPKRKPEPIAQPKPPPPTPVEIPPASFPPVAEIPKETVSEKEDFLYIPAEPSKEVLPVPVSQPEEPPELRDLGRGGDLHRTMQKRLQTEAHSLGFHAEIEGRLKEGSNAAADLILRVDDFAIAVELPVEGSLSYEFGNVKKCLAAGFSRVAVVSLRPKLLVQLAEAVSAALGADAAAKVGYHTPEEFIAELRKLAQSHKPRPELPPNTEVIGNFEVEVEYPTLTPEERKQREEAAIRLIAETMRQTKRN